MAKENISQEFRLKEIGKNKKLFYWRNKVK